ncbi:aquaporin [Hornefia butyriciproducens]|uniref:aquaporin n=1 Tax=Hornefia butyriciproducens TaxID=2652293 RepID=UPI002A91FCB4|nr:aquaporin [Hornefia butyriciproducens]MDY5422738.1 aquaporin [Hornefia butyriciproducens]
MRKYIAELIGTFVLTAFGCGTAVAANSIFLSMNAAIPVAFTTLLIAFAFGLSVVAMAYSIGNISGCHINPAVSVGMLAAGRISVKDCVGYVVAQCVGALAAALFLWMIFGSRDSLGQNGYGEASTLGLGAGSILILEIVMTFVFVLVVLAVTDRTEFTSAAGLVIGLTLTLIHIFGIPFDGTSVNPARSFGPAIVVGGDALAQLPVFIIAPLIGGVLAALVYRLLFTEVEDPAEELETDAEDVRPDDGEAEPEAYVTADGEDAAKEEEADGEER